MPSITKSPGACEGGIGSGDWEFVASDNAAALDGNYASHGVSDYVTVESVRLLNGTSFVGDDKATFAELPASFEYQSFGGSSDTWESGISVGDLRAGSVGVGFALRDGSTVGKYLRATDFDFSDIPDGATIDGIVADVYWMDAAGNDIYIDHIRITVYYTESPADPVAVTETTLYNTEPFAQDEVIGTAQATGGTGTYTWEIVSQTLL